MPGPPSAAPPPFPVRLDPASAAALAALCARWGCGRAEAVRRALREIDDRGAALRPVLDALSRIEGRLEAGPAGPRPAAGDLPPAPDAQAQAAADATGRLLAAWAMPEQNRVPEGGT